MKTRITTVVVAVLIAAGAWAQTELISPRQMASMTWPEAKAYIESLGISDSAFLQQFTPSLRQMSDSEFWNTVNDAYSSGWDSFFVGNIFLGPRISNAWEKTPPSPDFFMGLATNRDLHIGLRSAMAKAGLGCSSQWKTPVLCDYLDSLWTFLEDECVDIKWKLHVCDYLNSAYQWKIGDMAHNNTNTYDPSTFDLLHERAPRFFRYLSATLLNFTNKSDIGVIAAGDELTALTRTYVNRNPQASEPAARAVSAAQDARHLLATVLTDTNFHPKARERIRSQDDWIHVVGLSSNQTSETKKDGN